MEKLANQTEVLEFIFDCSKRDKLLMNYWWLDTWTPAEGAMIVCGVKPLPGRQTEIPDTAFGIDEVPLSKSSQRLKNARAILGNWQDEFVEEGLIPPAETKPYDFFNWCVDNGYLTDWLRLISSFGGGGSIEPGLSFRNGGVSDTERITIFPAGLMSALVGAAKSEEVMHRAIRSAIVPENRIPSQVLVDAVVPKPEVLLCQKSKPKPLDIVIDKAKSQASEPNNYQSVWAVLVDMAQKPGRQPPLMGYDEERCAIKIEPEDKMATEYEVFTKNALRLRMKRNEESAAKKSQ